MIGVYDYTVVLTYLSLISATMGIFVSLHGNGHPYVGIFFLMISGLCDAFDGTVARTKKNRTDLEKNVGVQLDSLVDIVAFGILPACIGDSMLWIYPKLEGIPHMVTERDFDSWVSLFVYVIMILYVLAALTRLAYFNATEEERAERRKNGEQVFYEGMPVTMAAIIFPLVMLFQYLLAYDLTPIYFFVMFITAFLFVLKIRIPKPGLKGVFLLVGIGVIEAIILICFHNGISVI